jgi:formylglycine-generating enzyme required for sulfatase activity
MRKIGLFMALSIIAVFFLFSGTIANIIEHKGLMLTIDKGALDGVQAGQKGIVKAIYKDPGGEYDVNIGLFVVRKTYERTAEIFVEGLGSGFKVEDARYVVFEKDLKPSVPATPATGKTDLNIPGTAESYLEEGDDAFASRKYDVALERYQKALTLDPQNLVIREKCREAQRLLQKREGTADAASKFGEYLQKADARYRKKDTKYSFLYLVEALRVYPEGKAEVQKRLRDLARQYPQELETVLNEQKEEIRDMYDRVIELLADGSTTRIAPAESKPESPEVTEKFLLRVKPKAGKLYQNEQGFWEAVFPNNLVMVRIPAGEFTLGSPAGQGDEDEHPAHKVKLGGYWLSKYETTFDQYDRFAQETGRQKPDDAGWGRGELPVVNVSWEDASGYCVWLSKKLGLNVRLPTEAEWEKAAYDLYPWGSAAPDRTRANFNNEIGRTTAVGSFPAGASRYGILDMAGNVWEWVSDWYSPGYYGEPAFENPQGPEGGSEKTARGGSWANGKPIIRSANRSSEDPSRQLAIIGFRVVIDDR